MACTTLNVFAKEFPSIKQKANDTAPTVDHILLAHPTDRSPPIRNRLLWEYKFVEYNVADIVDYGHSCERALHSKRTDTNHLAVHGDKLGRPATSSIHIIYT